MFRGQGRTRDERSYSQFEGKPNPRRGAHRVRPIRAGVRWGEDETWNVNIESLACLVLAALFLIGACIASGRGSEGESSRGRE